MDNQMNMLSVLGLSATHSNPFSYQASLVPICESTRGDALRTPSSGHRLWTIRSAECSVVSKAKIESPTYSEYFDLIIEGITRYS